MPRRRKYGRNGEGGRFTVEDRSSASLGAMTAYAASLAMSEKRDVVVREIGKEGFAVKCVFDGTCVIVTPSGGSRV